MRERAAVSRRTTESDVAALHREYAASGAIILETPRNFPWAYELKVSDPDGHVLRFGSEPRGDLALEG